MHLTPNGCVATQSMIQHLSKFSKVHPIWFKMLTYYVYAPLLNQIDALPLNVSYYF